MKQTVVQIKIVYIVAHERIIERYEFDDIEEWDIFFDSLKYFASCVERKFKAYMTYNIPIINYKID